MEKTPMTAAGYEKLELEIRRLKEERPVIIQAIAEAREHGDLSENAEYHAAKERQGFIEAQLGDMEGRVARAEIIDPGTLSGKNIKFGATVTLVDEDTDEESVYQIVGEHEANIREGRLSFTAPLARGLMSKEAGDRVEVVTPKGSKAYEILKVKFI